MPVLNQLLDVAVAPLRHMAGLMFSPESMFSVWSLACALGVAVAAILLRRRPGRRLPRARVWLRALFPRRIVRSSSTKADIGFFLLNVFAVGVLIGWAVLAAAQVGAVVEDGMTATFGAPAPPSLPEPAIRVFATVALFLAYETAYWLDHWSSHKVPFFWAFHKAHHTAEVLTPFTLFRVHPIESLKYGNIAALVIGAVSGLLAWSLGGSATAYTINGENLVLVGFIFAVVHLQHSHLWLATTGVWGRVVMSPAHHQIHHSDNPRHFDRNFGSTLAIWDWLAGTLYAPSAKRERVSFGCGAKVERPHSVTGTLVTPFVEAAETLRPRPRRRPAILPAE